MRKGEQLEHRKKCQAEDREQGDPRGAGQRVRCISGISSFSGLSGRGSEGEGSCQERQDLQLEGAFREDTSMRYGSSAGEKKQDEKPGRKKVVRNLSPLHLVVGLLVGASVILRASAAGIDPFYLTRIAAGKEAYQSARFQEAVEDFRIGCFGLLEQPSLLLECSARLALAQSAAGRIADADGTLRKMNELEGRFGAWSQVDLEPPARAEFSRLTKGKSGLAVLSASVASPPIEPMPRTVPVVVSQGPLPSPGRSQQPESGGVGAGRAPDVADARQLLSEKNYEGALSVSLAILERDPSSRDARKLALEAAALGRKYEFGVAQVTGLEPFRDGEVGATFYASVCLFETGSVDKARRLAEKSIPRLVPNAYVEYYKKRLLE